MSNALTIMAAGVALCSLLVEPAPPQQQPPPLPGASAVIAPPKVPPSDCRRCADLEKRIERIERHLGLAGGGRDDALPSTETTPAALIAPLVFVPGTNHLGHGPYMSKAYKPTGKGRWWAYKRCHGNTCQMEYYWVPGDK
jgi:hypothetical protein